jgi:hypothetical protein
MRVDVLVIDHPAKNAVAVDLFGTNSAPSLPDGITRTLASALIIGNSRTRALLADPITVGTNIVHRFDRGAVSRTH